jgi:hypothetical protein
MGRHTDDSSCDHSRRLAMQRLSNGSVCLTKFPVDHTQPLHSIRKIAFTTLLHDWTLKMLAHMLIVLAFSWGRVQFQATQPSNEYRQMGDYAGGYTSNLSGSIFESSCCRMARLFTTLFSTEDSNHERQVLQGYRYSAPRVLG